MKRVLAFLALPCALLIGALALLQARAQRPVKAQPTQSAAPTDPDPVTSPRIRRPPTFSSTAWAPPLPATPPAASEPWEKRQAAALIGAFEVDGRDGRWSTTTSSTLAAAMTAKAAEGIRLSPVECRSSLCRVKIATKDREALASYVRETLVDADPPLWRGAWFLDLAEGTEPAGAMAATVYLAREGHGLPQPLAEAP